MIEALVKSGNEGSPGGDNFSLSKIHLSTRNETHKNLTNKPMTNWRSRNDLCTIFPELKDACTRLYDGDALLDIGCGEGNALKELAFKFPRSTLTGVDMHQVPSDILNVEYLQGDIEQEAIWNKIPENQRLIRSCFVAMYLKNPFQLLVRVQEKLAKDGEAFIHLGYLEQYAGGEAMIRKHLACLSPQAVTIKKPLSATAYHRPTKETDMYVGNYLAHLHPVVVKISAKDDLTALADCKLNAEKIMYIEKDETKYIVPYSDQWYIYSV